MSQQVLDEILEIEWEMFRNVKNIGGTASCQENQQSFLIMRTSQASAFSHTMLQSYLEDLKVAQQTGHNLMTEKYARMMQSTSPQEYEQLKSLLPAVHPEAQQYIDKIVPIVMEFERQLASQYPFVLKVGRPLYATEDTPQVTSVETYLKGELSTYSTKTLSIYYQDLLEYQKNGVNPSMVIMENTVKQYGYPSLDAANQSILN